MTSPTDDVSPVGGNDNPNGGSEVTQPDNNEPEEPDEPVVPDNTDDPEDPDSNG